MNKEQAIKKMIDELKRYLQACEVEEPKKYYWTSVYENNIYHSEGKDEIDEKDVVYEDENIIVEHNEDNKTFVSYKNGKKP